MPKPRIIIFDLDGVILDSNKLTTEYFFTSFPTGAEHLYRESLCGNYIEETAKLGGIRKVETEEEKTARFEIFCEDKERCAFFDGISELLRELHKIGSKICLNTSSGTTSCVPSLKKHGLLELFDFIGTKEVSPKKTEKFEMIKEKYGALASEMIFITDTLGDIREADHSGVPTIAVTWGIHDREYFNREPHENVVAIVDSVAELRNKLML